MPALIGTRGSWVRRAAAVGLCLWTAGCANIFGLEDLSTELAGSDASRDGSSGSARDASAVDARAVDGRSSASDGQGQAEATANDAGGVDASEGDGAICTPETDPETCIRLGKSCGTVAALDTCGTSRSFDCGACTAPATCSAANTCVQPDCMPENDGAFCTRLGKNCGSTTGADNCGKTRTAMCGTCTQPDTCGAGNLCVPPNCAPEADAAFCSRVGKNCGSVTDFDNCGKTRTAACGTCTAPKACGANGVCACTAESDPVFCSRLSKSCGSVAAADNCGTQRTANCGSCTQPKACSAANVCVCTAESDTAFCSRLGKNCGSVAAADNCGTLRTATCGSCTLPATCGANNVCACVAENNPTFCSRLGKTCGNVTAADNCGTSRTAACGTCVLPTTCGASNVCACVPESNTAFCSRLGKTCGSVAAADNCGTARTVSCGSCSLPKTCGAANVCVDICTDPTRPNLCGTATCVNFTNDASNCGSCNHGCGGQPCNNSKCVPPPYACLGMGLTGATFRPSVTMVNGGPPARAGGTVVDGTYLLTSLTYYGVFPPSYYPQIRFEIAAPYYRTTTEDEDASTNSPLEGFEETGSFSTSITAFHESWHYCQGDQDGVRDQTYTATSTTLVIWAATENALYTYTRQ